MDEFPRVKQMDVHFNAAFFTSESKEPWTITILYSFTLTDNLFSLSFFTQFKRKGSKQICTTFEVPFDIPSLNKSSFSLSLAFISLFNFIYAFIKLPYWFHDLLFYLASLR